ncbi:cyclic nucleotide-binding domain-containing protein [Actinomadura sp. SCN-SB]|uniref:cyclic nucleotide-binding domain-containing protein n=1 Tax=Actinomadura sp. SCN-SB TaxID=3373092 RepID=UPI003753CD14
MGREPRFGRERNRRRGGAPGTVVACAGGAAVAVAAAPGLAVLVVLSLVLLAAIPIVGCTIMLLGLARCGIQTARSPSDVRELMEFGTTAFTTTLATLLRTMPPRMPPHAAAPSIEQPRAVQASAERPPAMPAPAAPAKKTPNTPLQDGRRRGPALDLVPPHTFWSELTPAERGALDELMGREDYAQGTVLWRKDQQADRVIIIRSGQARVSTGVAGDDREIARRGPGDIVGERAMLLVRERSATVTALTPMRVMTSSAAVFNAFLNDHPRVVAVLERQIYDRLTRSTRPPGAPVPPLAGQHCAVLFVDVAGFSAPHRNDQDRREIRRVLYVLLEEAFERSGVPWGACHHEDRGDGALIVVPAGIPAGLIVHPLIGRLSAALARHNRGAREPVRIRLRAALDVGPVTADRHGVNGYAIIRAARLLEAPALKTRLNGSSAPLGFVVSDQVYDSVVRHAPAPVDPAAYIRAQVTVKESRLTAWTYLPG